MARLVEPLRAGAAWHNGAMTMCRECGLAQPASAFTHWGIKRGQCRACTSKRNREYGRANRERRNERLRDWRRENPEAARAKDLRARLMRKYGLTPDEVAAMRAAQDERCLLCDSTERELVVDHDHSTGRVRGLLCRSCNTIVGQLELAPLLVARLGEYLRHGATSEFAISRSTSA